MPAYSHCYWEMWYGVPRFAPYNIEPWQHLVTDYLLLCINYCYVSGEKCTGFPGPGAMSSLQANPMHEFIEFNGHEKVHEMFEHFLSKFPRRYANTVEREEHHKRRDIFRQNLRYSSLTDANAFHHFLWLLIFMYFICVYLVKANALLIGKCMYIIHLQLSGAHFSIVLKLFGWIWGVINHSISWEGKHSLSHPALKLFCFVMTWKLSYFRPCKATGKQFHELLCRPIKFLEVWETGPWP